MPLTFVPISYRICCHRSTPEVEGYAVLLPAPFSGLRFCVRKHGGEWTVDHYDSGYSVGGPVMDVFEERPEVLRYVKRWTRDGRSRARVVRWLVKYLRHRQKQRASACVDDRHWVRLVSRGGWARWLT